MSKSRTLHALIRGAYSRLSEADRRVADLILNFPGGLPGYSGSDLARMASTSNATVSRFVRKLGFADFEEMRRRARAEMESGTPVYLIGRSTIEGEGDLLDRHAETAIDNIRRSAASIDREDFGAMIEAVASARRVWIAGFRHGYAIANYLRWSLAHARSEVHLLPASGDTLGEHLVDMSSDDVLIVLAFRRRVPAIAALCQFAADTKVAVAILTDPGLVEDHSATWLFPIFCQTRGPIDDHAAALVMAHAITESVIAKLGSAARDRFANIDSVHDALDELKPR